MPQLSLVSVLGVSVLVLSVGGVLALGALEAAEDERNCELPYASGNASSLVSMTTTETGEPAVSFPTPLVTTGREVTVLQEGEGEPVREGGYVDFDVSIFVGSDKEYLTGSNYSPDNPVRRAVSSELPDFFSQVLECQRPGSQLVATTELAEIFGSIEEDGYLRNTSTVVAVIDVHNTYPARADGAARLPQSGLPTITQAPTGEHGFSFPNAPIPTELRVSVLKQGTGEAIMEGDLVTAHFTGVVWNSRQVFISSFDQGIPLSVLMLDQTVADMGAGVIPGLAQALIGQPVGSQILVSVPPEFGYREGERPPGVEENSTLVFVFDILGKQG